MTGRIAAILIATLAMIPFSAGNARAADGGFLFVTFQGEQTPMSEQIYFVASDDGHRWQSLNSGKPVLVSTLGDKGVRDPFLLRSHDGKTYYLLATDLSINLNPNWGRASTGGSQSIVIWESTDLVHWSEPRLEKVAPNDAGCTWAPEAIYDETEQNYLVFWASRNKRDDFAKHRIWACRTTDFKTFTEPFIYIERPHAVIDTDIVFENGNYYRFSKDEDRKSILMETSDRLTGTWHEVPTFTLGRTPGVEGPECFVLKPGAAGKPATWCLVLDRFATGQGYQPWVTTDLKKGQFTEGIGFEFPFRLRHGSIMPVSAEQMAALKSAYPIK